MIYMDFCMSKNMPKYSEPVYQFILSLKGKAIIGDDNLEHLESVVKKMLSENMPQNGTLTTRTKVDDDGMIMLLVEEGYKHFMAATFQKIDGFVMFDWNSDCKFFKNYNELNLEK